MTSDAGPRQEHQDLFVADFHPPLGEYLAGRYTAGYAAAAGRARFRAWLTERTNKSRRPNEWATERGNDRSTGQ